MRWFIYLWIFIFMISCASNALNKKKEAEIHFRLGDSYLRQGKPGFALRELVQAQKLDPQNPDIYLDLGLAYMARGDLDKAEAQFKKSIQLNPEYGAAYNNLGLLYLRQKKLREAERCFKKAISIYVYPTPEVAYTNLGSCYILQSWFLLHSSKEV